MGKIKEIAGYRFEKISEDTYIVTYPNGNTLEKYITAAESLMRKLQKEEEKKDPNYIQKQNEKAQKDMQKLKSFCETMNAFQDVLHFDVQNCYKDIGSGTTWITPVAFKRDGSSYMFFMPAEQEELLNASYTEFSKIVSNSLTRIKKQGY